MKLAVNAGSFLPDQVDHLLPASTVPVFLGQCGRAGQFFTGSSSGYFSTAPAPAPIKSRLSTIYNKFLTPRPSTRKIYF